MQSTFVVFVLDSCLCYCTVLCWLTYKFILLTSLFCFTCCQITPLSHYNIAALCRAVRKSPRAVHYAVWPQPYRTPRVCTPVEAVRSHAFSWCQPRDFSSSQRRSSNGGARRKTTNSTVTTTPCQHPPPAPQRARTAPETTPGPRNSSQTPPRKIRQVFSLILFGGSNWTNWTTVVAAITRATSPHANQEYIYRQRGSHPSKSLCIF